MLNNTRFHWNFFRARMKEIFGDFLGAARLMERESAPEALRPLQQAYRLRMLVLASKPEDGPKILESLERYEWYNLPKTIEDKYVADYCRYMSAGVRGEIEKRKALARRLKDLPVKKIYHNALRIVEPN